ncbi:uncharacterized protein LOC130446412 [Diorhabda sublineata]|uniref:uncharacterized protein LOC130446412 n=1 Tax=Diorhabda sublineata TaxID=1163346 RepID=UPI0024E07E0B|nr:uncharacterized protein LOC130446412 [Diorhabda sublineata]
MAATKIKSGKSLHTDAVSPVNNIFKKLSKSSEWYTFRKQPIGCIYSAAATTASKSGRMTSEARIYFAFKTMRKETPVDETLEKIIFKHDTLEVNLISALIDSLDAYPLLTVIKYIHLLFILYMVEHYEVTGD